MRTYVIDASIIVKWIFPDQQREDHVPQALNVLQHIKQSSIKVIQPPHWLAESAAVITRLQPSIADKSVSILHALEFAIVDDIEIYQLACQLSASTQHHLFDTLYHAVALIHGAQLITADEVYYKKTHKKGAIVRLTDFNAFNN